MDTLRARFTDQLVAVLAFDSTNPACTADPTNGMDHPTLAACAHVESTSLPSDLVITKDAARYSPHETMMLVIDGAAIDARHPWFGIIGLGPAPKKGSSSSGGLVHGAALGTRPLGVPLVAAGAVSLINPGTVTLLFLLGAAAILLNNGVLVPSNEARPAIEATQREIERQNRPTGLATSAFEPLKTRAQAEAKAESTNTTDGGWMAAAGCIDDGSLQKMLGWGHAASEDAAKEEAYDNAINRNSFPPRSKWNAIWYCEILLVCQRTGASLDCR